MLKKMLSSLWALVGQASPPVATARPLQFPPLPAWRPTVPVDIERVAQTFSYYLNGKRAFAVMEHGTCVILPDGTQDADHAAAGILRDILHAHPDMSANEMDDGHWLITYSRPEAATVVFNDVVDANWDHIESHHQQGVTGGEVLLNSAGEHNTFDRTGKIGLFGRAYMFMDAVSPRVVKVCRPKGP